MDKRTNKLNRIVRLGYDRAKVEGVYLDRMDAQISVQILSQLPEPLRAKYLAMPVGDMVDRFWEIINKGERA